MTIEVYGEVVSRRGYSAIQGCSQDCGLSGSQFFPGTSAWMDVGLDFNRNQEITRTGLGFGVPVPWVRLRFGFAFAFDGFGFR